jgi:hypothetical protein
MSFLGGFKSGKPANPPLNPLGLPAKQGEQSRNMENRSTLVLAGGQRPKKLFMNRTEDGDTPF